jgi:hypothetical protein
MVKAERVGGRLEDVRGFIGGRDDRPGVGAGAGAGDQTCGQAGRLADEQRRHRCMGQLRPLGAAAGRRASRHLIAMGDGALEAFTVDQPVRTDTGFAVRIIVLSAATAMATAPC